MKTVSMVDLRQNAERIIEQGRRGEAMVLTYRGQPAIRLEPLAEAEVRADDPFYALHQLADSHGKSLSNRQMDKLIYGT
jgi:antitoxin (DNA-binding transcriptional repressor) of toxin-antitoxin stability system